MEDSQTKSVLIIQRSFRKYLRKKREQKIIIKGANNEGDIFPGVQIAEECINLNCENGKPDFVTNTEQWVEEMHKEINDIYEDLDAFYKSLPNTLDRTKYIENVLIDIDGIISKFQNVCNINDCQNLPPLYITEEAQRKHQESLNKLNVKWWENL